MTMPAPQTLEREKDKLYLSDAELIRRLGVPDKERKMEANDYPDPADRWEGWPDPPAPIRRRIAMEEGCMTCAELARGSFGPSHDPSPRCESGKRPHCTCDICF